LVQGALAGGVIAGLDFWRWPAWALKSPNQPAVLTGSHFDLAIEELDAFRRRACVKPRAASASFASQQR
jgi:hypothetical protein